jgi:hypothetical protein
MSAREVIEDLLDRWDYVHRGTGGDEILAALDAAGLEVRPKQQDREAIVRAWVEADHERPRDYRCRSEGGGGMSDATGGFSVRQDGMVVASGSGPYEDIKREAAHYAAVYRQDGPVKVRVWKHKAKEPPHA